MGTTRRVFSRLPGEMRFNHLLDSLLFVAMTLTMVSGVLSSESALATMGIAIKSDHFWGNVHGAFAYATIGMVGVHLGMHVRWIVSKLKRTRRGGAFMIHLRRALLIVLASVAMALAGAQLGRTPWAEGIRERTERYLREHPRPVAIVTAPTDDHRPRRRVFVGDYLYPFVGPLCLVGATGGLTLLVLRRVGRRGKRAG